MSRHSRTIYNKTFVFGWDQPVMSYFLQVHDNTLKEEENPEKWLVDGMYELEDLIKVAKNNGLEIDQELAMELYSDRDEGR